MQGKEIDQGLERRAERRRRHCCVTPKPEVARFEAVTEPETEIVVMCEPGTFLEQPAIGFETQLECRRPGHFGR